MADKSLNTVEIDLSNLERAGVPVAEFDRAILESAPRVWLYNHRVEKELEAWREAQERYDIEVARAHIDQLRDRLFLSAFEDGDPSEEELYVRIRDLGEFIDIELPGNWASPLSATFWQAAALRGVISELVVEGDEVVTPAELKAFLQDLPDQPFDLLDLPPRIADRVRAELSDFQSLDELSQSYHQALVQRGFLDPRGRVYPAVITRANDALKRYQQAEAARIAEKKRLDAEQAQRLAAIEMERQRENRRDDARRKVEEFVSGLLEAVPRESRAGFAFAQWWDTPLASGKTPESFIQHGDAWFLLHKLEELKQLFVSGSAPLDNLLNLPLDSVRSLRIAEAETARKAKQKADAEIRQRHVEAWSRRRDQEPDWIDTPQLVLGNLSPRQVINGPDAAWRQLQVRESRKDELARQARDGPRPEREEQFGSLPLW